MTRSLPNRPLWPRSGRSGRRAAAASSSSTGPDAVEGLSPPAGDRPVEVAARPKPTGRSATSGLLPERPMTLHPLEDPALAVVEPRLDIGREEKSPGGGPDPERDGDGELGLVTDGDRDPAHAQLRGPGGGPAVEAHRGLSGRQPLDLDVPPADAADAQAQDLADRLLGRPAPRHGLRPATHVTLLGGGQDPPDEAIAEALQRGPDPLDADDVDAELGRPGRHQAGRHDRIREGILGPDRRPGSRLR